MEQQTPATTIVVVVAGCKYDEGQYEQQSFFLSFYLLLYEELRNAIV
jgi:hypothetical protein